MHVHIAGPKGESDRLYYASDRFTKSVSFDGIKIVTKLNTSQITGPRYFNVLLSQLKQSKNVDKIVLLALDKVYTEEGHVDDRSTHLYVSSEYVAHISQMYPQFLNSCSVHPYRENALAELYRCAEYGAVFNKWVPSSQCIDPTHPKCRIFYRALAKLKMPLLLHMGPEEAIPTSLKLEDVLQFDAAAGKYGPNPGDAIVMALEEGATVIAAHCSAPLGKLFDKNNDYWEKVFKTLLLRVEGLKEKKGLYADTSAFCLPGRFKYVQKIIPLAKEMPDRFLYGSDFPIPIVSFKEKSLDEILETFGWLAGRALPTNDLDQNYQLLEKHFPKALFTAANTVLRNPHEKVPSLKKYQSWMGIKPKRKFWF
jgi:predicted TIM-barrel fold metal-dependent hydrolase